MVEKVSSNTRMIGLIAILIGFFISLTGIGAIIGVPLMIIGFLLFIPELFIIIAIIIIVIVVLILL